MQTWTHDNHADYGAGPWANEPDKAVWIDPSTNYDCMIHRNHSGALCGYVGVGPDHFMYESPYSGNQYNAKLELERVDLRGTIMEKVEVHGGLTYASKCSGDLCHVAQPGRPKHVWWFGFDCAHMGDLVPFTVEVRKIIGPPFEGDRYRNFEFVKIEVESLAMQLSEIDSDFSDCLR